MRISLRKIIYLLLIVILSCSKKDDANNNMEQDDIKIIHDKYEDNERIILNMILLERNEQD
jgi:hypothetical protein